MVIFQVRNESPEQFDEAEFGGSGAKICANENREN